MDPLAASALREDETEHGGLEGPKREGGSKMVKQVRFANQEDEGAEVGSDKGAVGRRNLEDDEEDDEGPLEYQPEDDEEVIDDEEEEEDLEGVAEEGEAEMIEEEGELEQSEQMIEGEYGEEQIEE